MSITPSKHDPFQSITLASSALKIFRTDILEPDSIEALSVEITRRLKKCLAGGRTGTTKLFVKPDPKVGRLLYVDFCSAYPWVNKYGLYPYGKMTFHWCEDSALSTPVPSFEYLEHGASIWRVDIKCPTFLYHPLLHSKDPETGLLLFDLHDKKDAMYTNLELVKALQLGYTITKVYEVFYWEDTTVGLFKGYIDIFLKIKQESSGWPTDCGNDTKRQQFIVDYLRQEQIALDMEAIHHNPGRRQTSKLYLNSLWGKMGQRLPEEFTTTHIVHDTPEGIRYFNNLMSKEGGIQDVLITSDHSVILTEKKPRDAPHLRLANTNIALAIFTTAQARLKLYNELLEPLGRRVCYYDTDSVIFYAKHSEMKTVIPSLVPLGPNLGDVTSEIGASYYYDEKNYITEFVSGGPKNYGYITTDMKKKIKIKGHSVNRMNMRNVLNYNNMKRCVLDGHQFHVTESQITRGPGFKVYNHLATKKYRLAFMKRRIINTPITTSDGCYMIDTVPWSNSDELTTTMATQVNSSKSLCDISKPLLDSSVSEKKLLSTHFKKARLMDNDYCVIITHNEVQGWMIAGLHGGSYGEYVSTMLAHGFKKKILVEKLSSEWCEEFTKNVLSMGLKGSNVSSNQVLRMAVNAASILEPRHTEITMFVFSLDLVPVDEVFPRRIKLSYHVQQ